MATGGFKAFEHMYHIYYKDVANDDPMWHLYDDFWGASLFHSLESARQYIKEHSSEFVGCVTRVRKDRASV